MAPAQSRQLLIWSLPTLVLLFGFFWYKRKKSFFRTDPGGKDDDEYTVHDLKFNSEGTTKEDTITLLQSREVTELKLDSFGFDYSSYINTSTPLDIKKRELRQVVEHLSSPEEIEIIKELIYVHDSSESEEVICGHDSSESDTNQSEEQKIEEHLTQKLISTADCLNPMVQKRKQISSDSSVEIVSEITNSTDSSSCLTYEENSLQSTDAQECDNKENSSLNSNTYEAEGFKNLKVLSECEASVSSVNKPCAETSFQKELDNILESKMTEKEIGEEKSENSAAIEKKLSNLGLNTTYNTEKTERDSANHSPSEVMLGSPSMCSFSDVHSEGSSDSGKGCSDVVTPPSRTPAGGSSVAGDQILSVYEFVLEQHIVGRLIGRHGTYLQDIRAKTNTNLFIKRHPETTKLKICAIEGTQQDIDAALAMIRQKFPLRRFPNLTLEKVTFVQPSSHYPLKPDIFQDTSVMEEKYVSYSLMIVPYPIPFPCLIINNWKQILVEINLLQLVDGVNNDVLLSSLITAGHFFLQQPTHPSYPSLHRLNIMMNALYSSPEAPPLSEPIVDAICVAPTMGGWYRAQIMNIDEQNATSDVRFLDYGGYLTVNNSLLRQIRGDFLLLPFQAIECMLANVVPAGFTTVSNAPNVFRMTETLRRSLKSKYRYGNPEDHTWSLLTKSYYLQLVTLLNYSRAIVSVLKCIRDNEKMDNLTTVQAIGSSVLIGGEGAEWSEEARQVVQCLTQQQVLQAQVYDYTETGIPLVYLYSTHGSQNGLELVLINQDLVARGYAEMVVPSSAVVP